MSSVKNFDQFIFKAGRNNHKAYRSIRELTGNTRRGIRQGLIFSGQKLKTTARRGIMTPPKSGRRYKKRIGGRSYNWRASAPGQFPANVTGRLRDSVDYQMQGDLRLRFGVRKTGSANAGGTPPDVYAKFLELGSPAGKIKPRPFLKSSLDVNEGQVKDFVLEQIKMQSSSK
jgi:hypothetical protein